MTPFEWKRLLIGLLLSTFGLFFLASVFALYAGFWPPTAVWPIYMYYSLCTIILVHVLFFGWKRSIETEGRRLPKSLPKYLDYIYTIVVALGLFQVFAFTPRYADYMVWLQGDQIAVAERIKAIAVGYVSNECVNKGTRHVPGRWWESDLDYHYDTEYCAKMKGIADAEDLIEHLSKNVVRDYGFLERAIESSWNGENAWAKGSPIEGLALRFRLLEESARAKDSVNPLLGGALAWVGLLMLPIGIAIRLVKTSLELFGNLE
jgi:hypothetical protein